MDELLNHWQKLPTMKAGRVRILFVSGRTESPSLEDIESALETALEKIKEKHSEVFYSHEECDAFVAMQLIIVAQWKVRLTLKEADIQFLRDIAATWVDTEARALSNRE